MRSAAETAKAGCPWKQPHRALTALSDPVAVHGDEVDAGGPDLATQVHKNAKVLCDRLGVACGCQMSLPDGLCIVNYEPCPFAPAGGSREPYASEALDAAGKVVPRLRKR